MSNQQLQKICRDRSSHKIFSEKFQEIQAKRPSHLPKNACSYTCVCGMSFPTFVHRCRASGVAASMLCCRRQ